MLERVVGHLADHGVTEVVLSVGYRPDDFLAAYPEATCAGVDITYAIEPEPLNTAGAIRFAAEVAGIDETFVVCNGDVLTELDIGALVAFHHERDAEATVALAPVVDVSLFGVVVTDDAGQVSAFVEKPDPADVATNLINAGTYVLDPSVLARIPKGRTVHLETETFPAMANAGTLYALASDAYWTDVGTPALFLQANLDCISGSGRDGRPPVRGARQRRDGVWTLGASVVHGEVAGPALIGDAAFIDHDARVSGSVIGPGCRVERGATVVDSVLLSAVAVRPGAVVRRSIVGENALVGDRAVIDGLTVIAGSAEVPAERRLVGATLTAPRPSEGGLR